jgi:hypothetical protein
MATLRIEGVPEELCCRFRSMPDRERSNIVEELLERLERCAAPPLDPETLARLLKADREIARRITLQPLTPELIEGAIAEGRP